MNKMCQLDVWVITRVAIFVGQAIDSQMDCCAYWYLNDDSKIEVDCKKKEIRFVDWVGDDKTYYSIVGVAASAGYEYGDYFTE
jgi:hypothetical protein